jgi:hypothetical protein
MASKLKATGINMEAGELKALNQPILNKKAEDLSSYTFWQYTSI